jgi:hypothetical protein
VHLQTSPSVDDLRWARPILETVLRPARTKNGRSAIQKAVPRQKRRCWAIEAFWLKIGLPDRPVNSDNNSIGVLSPARPGMHFIFHSRKGTWAHFLPFCRAGSVFNMAAQFGNVPKYTPKSVEKGGVEAPRSITLSTPILLFSLFSGQSGNPIFRENRSIAQQRLFFLKHGATCHFSCAPVLNLKNTHHGVPRSSLFSVVSRRPLWGCTTESGALFLDLSVVSRAWLPMGLWCTLDYFCKPVV